MLDRNIESGGHDVPVDSSTFFDNVIAWRTIPAGPNVGDGVVRFQQFTNVLNTGRRGYLQRVKEKDPAMWGGLRAVLAFEGSVYKLNVARDYWFAYAVHFIPGEMPYQNGVSRDRHQIGIGLHPYGDVMAALEVHRDGQTGTIQIWNAGSVQAQVPISTGHQAGMWHKHIVHIREGWLLSQAPVLEYWIDGVKILSQSGSAALNPYAENHAATGGYYAKMGLYKFWDYDTFGSYGPNTRAQYVSDLYFAEGNTSDMYARAEAALVGF